ncbi:MAG: hypothetical protein ACK4RM_01625 [Flavobacterium sp.]
MKKILLIGVLMMSSGVMLSLFNHAFWIGSFTTGVGILLVLFTFKKIADSY